MDKEQRQKARLVHKSFFDKCQFAIDNGFYLEAILLEYASMESRANKIMSLLEAPCGICPLTNITNGIGLNIKISCIRNLIEKNDPRFEDSYFNSNFLTRLKKWCNSRNERIHNLYRDTEKYDKMMNHNEKYAKQGLENAKIFYKETNRLKRLKKKSPELFSVPFVCEPVDGEPIKNSCEEANQWNNENKSTQ